MGTKAHVFKWKTSQVQTLVRREIRVKGILWQGIPGSCDYNLRKTPWPRTEGEAKSIARDFQSIESVMLIRTEETSRTTTVDLCVDETTKELRSSKKVKV